MSAKKTNSNSARIRIPAAAAFLVFAVMLVTSAVCVIRTTPPEPDPTTRPAPRMDLHAMQDTRVTWHLPDGFTFYSLPSGEVYVFENGERVRLTEDMLPYTLRGDAAPERLVQR